MTYYCIGQTKKDCSQPNEHPWLGSAAKLIVEIKSIMEDVKVDYDTIHKYLSNAGNPFVLDVGMSMPKPEHAEKAFGIGNATKFSHEDDATEMLTFTKALLNNPDISGPFYELQNRMNRFTKAATGIFAEMENETTKQLTETPALLAKLARDYDRAAQEHQLHMQAEDASAARLALDRCRQIHVQMQKPKHALEDICSRSIVAIYLVIDVLTDLHRAIDAKYGPGWTQRSQPFRYASRWLRCCGVLTSCYRIELPDVLKNGAGGLPARRESWRSAEVLLHALDKNGARGIEPNDTKDCPICGENCFCASLPDE